MDLEILEFEKPIVELDEKINELRNVGSSDGVDVVKEIATLEDKRDRLLKSVFTGLSRAQVVKVARHPKRPHAIDYIETIFTDFDELHGDRHFADDPAIIAGLARFNDQPVLVIGEEKGRTTKEKIKHNFAMPRPEGYRKALRLMKMAEKYDIPIITFIDTPGAYPGIDAEERNQSEAIARNLFEMAELTVPVICIVIGEGGSGGALAIGVGDRVLMLQHSIYSVISPEGCASILWRSADKADEAAEAMKVTAQDSLENKLIDAVIPEPLGGAHRNVDATMAAVKHAIEDNLTYLNRLTLDELLQQRYDKLMSYGIYE